MGAAFAIQLESLVLAAEAAAGASTVSDDVRRSLDDGLQVAMRQARPLFDRFQAALQDVPLTPDAYPGRALDALGLVQSILRDTIALGQKVEAAPTIFSDEVREAFLDFVEDAVDLQEALALHADPAFREATIARLRAAGLA